MIEQFQHIQQEMFAITQEWRRQSYEREVRVGTWLLVGNGAALLFCFNAVANNHICDWSKVQPFALVFFLGLVWALSSVTLGGEASNRAAARFQKVSGAARQVAIAAGSSEKLTEIAPTNPAAVQQIVSNNKVIDEATKLMEQESPEPAAEKRLNLQANVCRVLSALALGGAILVAISTPTVATAVCAVR